MKEELKRFLARREVRHISAPERVPSAVLLPLFEKNSEWHILLIKRTENVSTHKGQISFPGGAYEPADGTMLNAALRESTEEIGLARDKVEILGELDDELSAVSHYLIAPFVGAIPYPYPFKVDGFETEGIIEAPLAALLNKDIRRDTMREGKLINSYIYYYQGREIWGTTARILHKFFELYTQALTSTKLQ